MGWVYLLSSSYSLLQLLVGLTMAHPLLLPLLTGVHERLILRTSALQSSKKFGGSNKWLDTLARVVTMHGLGKSENPK